MWLQLEKLMEHTADDWTGIYQDKIIKDKIEHNASVFRNIVEKNWRSILNDND